MDPTVTITRRKFSFKEYYQLAEVGILKPHERVELIEGEIVVMAAIGSLHAAVVDRLTRLFTSRLGERIIARVQGPIRLAALLSELQPDGSLLIPRADFYSTEHPGPADTLLVVEVMHSSVAYDRRIKLPLYARAGIVETWLVDIELDQVESYRAPSATEYRESRIAWRGESLVVQAFPDTSFAVTEILGS